MRRISASAIAAWAKGGSVRKAVVNALPKNVCYRSWWRQTKPRSNESVTPTPNPLRVDRAPPKGGSGLPAVALGAWGLGAVTPVVSHGLWPLDLWYHWLYQPEAPALYLGLANL